jgi:WD40 repeat protein
VQAMKFLFTSLAILTLFTTVPLTLIVNNSNTNALAQTSSSNSSKKSWQNAKLINTLDLKKIYPNTSCPIYSRVIAVSTNSKYLAISSYSYERSCTGSADGKNSSLTLWNLQTGKLVNTLFKGSAGEAFNYRDNFEPPEGSSAMSGEIAHAIAWNPDSKTIAAALGNKTIKIWDSKTGKAIHTLTGHKYAVRIVAFSPDGKTLASGSSDKTIKLWHPQSGKLKTTLQGHTNIVNLVKFSPNNQTLISQTETKNIKLWNLQTGKLINTLNPGNSPGNLLAVAYSPNGKIVGTANDNNIVKLFDSSTGKLIRTLTGHKDKIRTLAFDLSGKTIVTSSDDNTIKIWDITTGQAKRTLINADLTKFKPSPITDDIISLSADNKTFASSFVLNANDGNYPLAIVRLWDLSTEKIIRDFPVTSPFTFSPNGNIFIGKIGEKIKVWQ